MHFDVVLSEFIHSCTNKRRRAQYSRGVDADVCVRASDVCAGNFSHSAQLLLQTIPSIFYARLVPWAGLILSPNT